MKKIEYLYDAKINQKGIAIIALMVVILVLAIVAGVALGYFTDKSSTDSTINNGNNIDEEEKNTIESDEEHVHNYDIFVRSEEATCQKPSKVIVKCECGEESTLEDTVIAEHTWHNSKIIKKETCQEEGEIQYTCTMCGESKTEKIEKLEHNFTVKLRRKKYKATEATLREPAKYYYKCQTCDEHGEETY